VTEPFVRISPERGVDVPIGNRLRAVSNLWRTWVRRELRVRYRQSLLRASWSLIQPVTILLTYGLVLTRVLNVTSEDAPYLTFAWAGIAVFTFVQQGLGQGVGCIQQAGPLLSRVYFPREVIPLSVIGTAAVDLGLMTAILVIVSWIQVGPPTIHLIGIVPVYLVLALWVSGLTMGVAAVTVFRRDLNHAMPLLLRALFILSPVMYPVAMLPGPAMMNPVAAVIEGTRDVVYRGSWPAPEVLGPHLLVGAALTAAGWTLLRRLEPRMGDFA
jgi:lipopolysaccharide transport system permease protein